MENRHLPILHEKFFLRVLRVSSEFSFKESERAVKS